MTSWIFKNTLHCTKNEVFIKDFLSKYDEICSFLQILLHLLKKILHGKFYFLWSAKSIFEKVNEAIGLLRKFQNQWPGASLVTIYKSFIRPHFDELAMVIYSNL